MPYDNVWKQNVSAKHNNAQQVGNMGEKYLEENIWRGKSGEYFVEMKN